MTLAFLQILLFTLMIAWFTALITSAIIAARLCLKQRVSGLAWGIATMGGAFFSGGFVSAAIGLTESYGHYNFYADPQFRELIAFGLLGIVLFAAGCRRLRVN